MNTLVTGNLGFLGKNLVEKLKRKGRFVIGLDEETNSDENKNNSPNVQYTGDIQDSDLLSRIITKHEIEEVYHLAAWSIQKHCAADPELAFKVNLNGTINLLGACRKARHKIKSIVISTSDKAFGEAPAPYTEESPIKPLFIYDSSKACQQIISLAFARNFNLPVKIVASSNFYGPGDMNITRIVPNTIVRLASNIPSRLWEDSQEHIREFVYVDDATEAFIIVSENGKNGEVYCLGGTEHLKISDLVKEICKIMGKDPEKFVQVAKRPLYLQELKEQFIDASKLQSLGWKANIPLDYGLRRSVEFYTQLVKDNKIHPMRFEEDDSIGEELGKYFKD